ncbi:CLUMA_CG015790, isoform B [Clunio marinus]|uniref:CLUMA_CG015790, isoform B n=1 Tax=Clunio marinus TaxID=568069 RepID=A0A1J1IR45_9DIPT|nr:CLUMA_CG015790, isoform B [Clunio marinus]
MKRNEKKFQLFLVVFFISFSICIHQCEGKDKHKNDKQKHSDDHRKNDHQHQNNHKNSTTGHHTNHTSSHNSNDDKSHQHNNASHIGWSLHTPNGQQKPPPGNPNGYALHHHESSHDSQHHPTHHQTHANPHHSTQSHDQPSSAVNHQQPQDTGASPLASGLGGFALGAVGGAAGGYLLSNALNSDDGDGEKHSENESTTIVNETTLSAILTQDVNITQADGVTTASNVPFESSTADVDTSVKSTDFEISNSTENSTILSDPMEVVTLATDAPMIEAKAAQKLAEPASVETTTVNSTDVSSADVQKLSLRILTISFVSTILLIIKI